MKKVFMLLALCALTMVANATTYNYLCGITDLTVDTLKSTTKNQYTITFSQKCKNTAEYTSKPETFYTSTVKIVLNSDDRTLEGVYTTEGANRTSNSANVNDQTINMVNTEFFRFFGADGKLCHGFFTFNNSKTSEANFQSLSMPNEFIFKGQLINARKFITDM